MSHKIDETYITKTEIIEAIKAAMREQGVSTRSLGEKIGVKHPQIVRVTRGDNYNMDTLLNILHGLGLKIKIVKDE
ncbi:XRE family transcriptional regulator [Brevibacillus sp. NRS-1366]|uniref:XRE family transcriptional regulator n=1 Tax=Brevibacillus sp. NRS-1366 TaxID=3233899 RepID=UPI003D20671F